MPEHNRRALMVVSTLVDCLSHKLRTPLSVISNELSVIKMTASTEDCDRALGRCREISDLLKSLTLSLASTEATELNAESLLKDSGFRDLRSEAGFSIYGDKKQLTAAFSCVRELLNMLPGGQSSQEVVLGSNTAGEPGALVRLTAPAHPLFQHEEPFECDSFSEFFCHRLDIGTTMAPIADSILWAHGGKVTIAAGGNTLVRIEFDLDKYAEEECSTGR